MTFPEGTMTEPSPDPAAVPENDDGVSLLALGVVFLRWRRTIVVLGLMGGIFGLGRGLLSMRQYVSIAMFIPQTSANAPSGLARAASQFGISVPSNDVAWGPPVYVELLRSQALLEPIALDTVEVAEKDGQRVAVMDLLEITAPTPALQTALAVRALRGRFVTATEVEALGTVRLSVKTDWPSVSLALAEKLLSGINQFNLDRRRSGATAEREFVEAQVAEGERALRDAEDREQLFLQRNRVIESPQLRFEHERLQREVLLRQQAYTALVLSRDDARIREVRDTPVITVLEAPRLPVVGEPRRSAQKGVMGGLAGGTLGMLLALLAHGVAGARQTPSEASKEFFGLLEEATPGILRRRRS